MQRLGAWEPEGAVTVSALIFRTALTIQQNQPSMARVVKMFYILCKQDLIDCHSLRSLKSLANVGCVFNSRVFVAVFVAYIVCTYTNTLI